MTELKRAVDQLRQSLDAIEPHLTQRTPTSVLEEFKATLDRVRTNVGAISAATTPAEYSDLIAKSRLRRAAQICQGVLTGLSDGTVTRSTLGFDRLRSAVGETLEQLEALKKKS
jgi:hypothetical protein